jgi:phage terminase large subunit GpA-like protein
MHFPLHYDEEYFKQLTGEKVVTKYLKGFPVRVWVKARARNDALDCRVYAMAALAIMNVNLDRAVDRLQQPKGESKKETSKTDPFKSGREAGWQSPTGGRSGRNWVKDWR